MEKKSKCPGYSCKCMERDCPNHHCSRDCSTTDEGEKSDFDRFCKTHNCDTCETCKLEREVMSTPPNTDKWEESLKTMLQDAGFKPIQFKLNNSGVRIISLVRQTLATEKSKIIKEIGERVEGMKKDRFWLGQELDVEDFTTYSREHIHCYNQALSDILALLKTFNNK